MSCYCYYIFIMTVQARKLLAVFWHLVWPSHRFPSGEGIVASTGFYIFQCQQTQPSVHWENLYLRSVSSCALLWFKSICRFPYSVTSMKLALSLKSNIRNNDTIAINQIMPYTFYSASIQYFDDIFICAWFMNN